MKKYFVTTFLVDPKGKATLYGPLPTRPVSAQELTEKLNKVFENLENGDSLLYPEITYKIQTVEDDTPLPGLTKAQQKEVEVEFQKRLKEERELRGTLQQNFRAGDEAVLRRYKVRK